MDTEDMDKNEIFELMLKDLGGFGRFQVMIMLISYISSTLCSINHVGPVFLAFSRKFKCIQKDSPILLTNNIQNVTDYDSICPENNDMTLCNDIIYDSSIMSNSVVNNFQLICDRLLLLPIIGGSYMAGVVIFSVFSGIWSDRYGRRPTLLFLCVLHIISSFLTAFSSSSYYFFVIVRFFVGGSCHCAWSILFVLMAEFTVEKRRVFAASVLLNGWYFGFVLLTLLAYWLRDWVHLQLASSVISLLLISHYFLVPESPRWLLQVGRHEEAMSVLQKLGKINGMDMNGNGKLFCEHFEAYKNKSDLENDPNSSKQAQGFLKRSLKTMLFLWKILAHPGFRNRFLPLVISWFAPGVVYYGMSFAVNMVDFDIFLVTGIKPILSAAFIFGIVPIYQKIPRTITLFIVFFISGLAAIGFIIVPTDYTIARLILYTISHCICSVAFYLIATYTPEVFSTDVRNLSYNILDGISKVGTVIAPFIVDLGGISGPEVPFAIFGTMMIVAAISFAIVPETKSLPLTQNIEELDHVNSRRIIDKFCFKPVNPELHCSEIEHTSTSL